MRNNEHDTEELLTIKPDEIEYSHEMHAARIEKIRKRDATAYTRFMKAAGKHVLSLRPGRIAAYIEDDPDSVHLVKTIFGTLLREVMDVVSINNVDDAKKFLRDNMTDIRIAIVDLDLGSGVEEGEELLQWTINQFEGTLPILVLSGHLEMFKKIKELGYPNVACMDKPMGAEELISAVKELTSLKPITA